MFFDSFNDLINMAGHGKYVWSCVVLSTLLIAVLFFNAKKSYQKQLKLNTKLDKLP